MCLIIDTNVAQLALVQQDSRFKPILDGLARNTVRIVIGGRLRKELLLIAGVTRVLKSLDQAGRVRSVRDQAVFECETNVVGRMSLNSDDPHILALAIVSKVRLLCTDDKALMADFTNKRIIDKPRGSVYGDPSHKPLLRKHCKCIGGNKRKRRS